MNQSATPPVVGLTLNFRDVARTVACVRSLRDDGVASVLIWDNSDDDGVSARELQSRFASEPGVGVVASPANLGFAAGVNRGLAKIAQRGIDAWVLLINNDARLRPGALAALRVALDDNPQAVVAAPDIENGAEVTGPRFYQRYTGLLTAHRVPGSFVHPSGCCLLIAPQRSGGCLLDEDFYMYGEDVALGWKLGAGRIAHVARTLVVHDGSASSGLGTSFYEERMAAAHWILARKLARTRFECLALTCVRFLTLPVRALVRAVRYRSTVPLRALRRGWRLAHGKDPLREHARNAIAQARSGR